ncbi:MAG TPA: sigma-54 dependent transcriptional regulator [Vicinamibacterales bacterium]|nr:sigma-54 dependent transcriptional regulator [Vicinamibacterales bacterium]
MTPERIAVVDDDRDYSAVLEQALRGHGYEVVVYDSGGAFLTDLSASTAPDLVLLDVAMPGLDGVGTLKRAKETCPELAVIMLSGQQPASIIVNAVRAGAADYIVKSAASLAETGPLGAAIRRVLEQRAQPVEPADRELQPNALRAAPVSPAMLSVQSLVERVADSDVPILITGESGVGKEVVAREIHRRSNRRLKAFVKVNCAALPSELLESELFGHERGAFTGAHLHRTGKFEFADGGTLMLDEIAEMPSMLQAKLLHVLQDRAVTRLGSNRVVPIDVRVIAATNRPIADLLATGEFRPDLYYRLQVIQIHVPALRERREEIMPFVEFFLARFTAQYHRRPMPLSDELKRALVEYPWPGNVRELENLVKRLVILQDESLVLSELRAGPEEPVSEPRAAATHAPAASAATNNHPEAEARSLLELAKRAALAAERTAIERTLIAQRWNRRKAARQLGVSYKTLLNKMKECGISDASTGEHDPIRD